MSDIRNDYVALDTNVCIFAVTGDIDWPACEELVFERLPLLNVFIPPQVLKELHHNLDDTEIRALLAAVRTARERRIEYWEAPNILIKKYEALGAKKGDALVAAELDIAGIRWLISENRHFLSEITDLPFTVITAADALAILRSEE